MWNILPNTVVTVSTNSLMLFYLNKSNSGNDMIWFLIIVFWSHRVQTLLVLYAALGFSCSTKCPLPRKYQLQLFPPQLGGSLGSPQSIS